MCGWGAGAGGWLSSSGTWSGGVRGQYTPRSAGTDTAIYTLVLSLAFITSPLQLAVGVVPLKVGLPCQWLSNHPISYEIQRCFLEMNPMIVTIRALVMGLIVCGVIKLNMYLERDNRRRSVLSLAAVQAEETTE
ncbi:hypothetical protein J6590_065143 [Homalodisca vitripennis]|nr:hypothetical protein J6590_065143 [Homalodisca vitripennis]